MDRCLSNVWDTALIFEAGGMLNSYSAGVVNTLLEEGIYFDSVYGASSGAINAINYASRDRERSKQSFTSEANDMPFRKVLSMALKTGLFGPAIIGQTITAKDSTPFDFEAFQSCCTKLAISATNRDTGATTYWTHEDTTSQSELMLRVRASLSFPLFMAPTCVDGSYYYDGALGEGAGILVPRAKDDGFEKFFIVCVHPRGFRKKEGPNRLFDMFFWKKPALRAVYDSWAQRYNEQRDELDSLERSGQAYVFYPEDQLVMNSEATRSLLEKNYENGYLQAQREVDDWKAFLGLSASDRLL